MDCEIGDIIDGRFEVTGLCSDSGGMGQVLFVEDITESLEGQLVLKYCREEEKEYLKRFRREVRLLKGFSGNSKVVSVLHSRRKHEPPYFVMKYYPEGDLISAIDDLADDAEKQEKMFNLMIDCIAELHADGVFHRDIKPQNFLRDGDNIVVSDFGLGMEPGSTSRFTSSAMFWGSQGYLPPEFHSGGFKHADEAGDIFMLGKSFYVLLTNQDPTYLMDNEVHPVLFHVIKRACKLDKSKRYQSLPELKQALQMAFDVILERGGQLGEVNRLISAVNDRLDNEGNFKSSDVYEFMQKLPLIEASDQIKICLELKRPFLSILTHKKLIPYLDDFLNIYGVMVESEQYGWAFAETIADNMQRIFKSSSVPDETRAKALELAIDAANRTNRFAAMDTCSSMITSVDNEELGMHVAVVMQQNQYGFVTSIEPSQCKSEVIRQTLRTFES